MAAAQYKIENVIKMTVDGCRYLLPTMGLKLGTPMVELVEGLKELKGRT